MNFLIPKERWDLIKPAGKKTKARYKAEKLAWQQSNIKVGDWVERIQGNILEHGNSQTPSRWDVGYKFEVKYISGDYANDSDGLGHSLDKIKPCKPPKPKEAVIETEHYRVKGVKVIHKSTSQSVAEHCYDPISNKTMIESKFWRSGDQFRELADICDQLDALKK